MDRRGERDRCDHDEEVLSLPALACAKCEQKYNDLTWTTNHGTRYEFCWLDRTRKAYSTISITVPTTTVPKYQVQWCKSREDGRRERG
jgi:hypothetical protein